MMHDAQLSNIRNSWYCFPMIINIKLYQFIFFKFGKTNVMVTELSFKYYHPVLNIAVQNVRNVWLLNKVPVKLTASLHRGALVFRLPDSGGA